MPPLIPAFPPHVLCDYAILADGELRDSRRATRRFRLDVLSPLGQRGDDIVGNHARDQFQLDIFGESLLLLAAAARLDRLEPESWRGATIAADAIDARWREPDAGI